jgi:L-ascorbate metabolism protein UlaG (beta-lactamase superfamily)
MNARTVIQILTFLQCLSTISIANQNINIHYLGHCAFILQFGDSASVITDYAGTYPYYSEEYNSPIYSIYGNMVPDIATFSHQHTDHYSPERLPEGIPNLLGNRDTLSYKSLQVKPVLTSESNISTYDNSTFIFRYQGLTICHSGDLDANMKAIDNPDQQAHLR